VVGGLLATAAVAVGVWIGAKSFSRPHRANFDTAVVSRGPFEIKLTERGNLQSGNNLTLRCLVESPTGTGILSIVDEGILVEKDQVVVELDSSRLRDECLLQKIRLDVAEAALKTADANTEIQKHQNESDVAASELKLELALLDLKKYKEGDYRQTRRLFLADIKFAVDYLKRARDKKAFTERLMRKGFTTTKMLEADRVGLKKSQIDMDLALERKDVFENFTHRRDLAEKESNAALYENELTRVRLRADAALSQRERNLLAAKRTFFVENERYQKYLRQIEACTIRTPRAGLVVYANEDGGRRSSGPLIYEGAVVRERQPLIDLPDVTDMQVSARIHESKIAQLREGLTVTVHVDAHAGKTYHGEVGQVALVPNSASWPNRELKEYTAIVKLTDGPGEITGLKPGMTAVVEILADRRESVLQAPVQSCVERGGRYFAWVLAGDGLNRHEIRPGKSNDNMIEVVDGLFEGEAVVLNPRSALPVEVAALEEQIPAAAEADAGGRWERFFQVPATAPAAPPGTQKSDVPESAPRALPSGTAAGPVVEVALRDARAPATAPKPPSDEAPSSAPKQPPDPMAVFDSLDQNHDSKVTAAELPERMKQVFSRMDTNGDQAIDKDEWKKGARAWSQQSEGRAEAGGGQ
jgi:HlyD family secretion protein